MSYTISLTDEFQAAANALAKGSYQRGLAYGSEAWSGGNLKGKAKRFAGGYARSRDNFLCMLCGAVPFTFITGQHGKRIVLLGADALTAKVVRKILRKKDIDIEALRDVRTAFGKQPEAGLSEAELAVRAALILKLDRAILRR